MIRLSARARSTVAALSASGFVALAGCAAAEPSPPASASSSEVPTTAASETPETTEAFADLESRFDARLGVHAIDTGTGAEVSWRDDERFAYASTVKALAAAAVLDEVGIDGLQEEVPVSEDDILPHSPVTEQNVGATMTLGEIAEAAVTQSDNAAGNYLFDALGGPQALDDALADVGDDVTTVSRNEPDLNEATPGDERDTTTPRAFAENLQEYVLGDTLTVDEEEVVADWLTSTQTGDTLVRANLPGEWVVGDKSGAGGYGSRGDIAVIWPTEGEPIVIAVLSAREEEDAEYDDALIAEAAETAVSALR